MAQDRLISRRLHRTGLVLVRDFQLTRIFYCTYHVLSVHLPSFIRGEIQCRARWKGKDVVFKGLDDVIPDDILAWNILDPGYTMVVSR